MTSYFAQVECLGNSGHDELGIADGSQVHKIHAISEQFTEFGCYLQSQAGFATAAGSGKRQQTHVCALE